jgi:membrane protease YdiL (CAAX protease family)
MATSQRVRAGERSDDVFLYFALACGVTWLLDLPLALAWLTGSSPPPYAMPLVGLGALGPTFAAFLIARRRGELRDVFGHWKTDPLWIALGLVLPFTLQLAATAIDVAFGGRPSHWFYPPVRLEHFAALLIFPLGEEFGWRGFAYPRLERRYGAVVGSLILGCVWGLWHMGMLFAPDPLRALPATTVAVYAMQLALWSVVMAWMFERGGRSIAVAIAIHAGEHLDNVNRAPETEVRLRVIRMVVLAVAAASAAYALTRRRRALAAAQTSRAQHADA